MQSRFMVFLLLSALGTAVQAQVLILGDSLSAAYGIPQESSWPELLRGKLEGLAPARSLRNASVSGETSAGGRSRLPALIESEPPELLLLELGGNDGLRGLPTPQLRANLEAMIQMATGVGATVLLFEMRIPPNYGQRYADAFVSVYAALADEHENVRLLPFFLAEIASDPEQWFLEDGIHPNAAAQPGLLGKVWPAVRSALED